MNATERLACQFGETQMSEDRTVQNRTHADCNDGRLGVLLSRKSDVNVCCLFYCGCGKLKKSTNLHYLVLTSIHITLHMVAICGILLMICKKWLENVIHFCRLSFTMLHPEIIMIPEKSELPEQKTIWLK